MSNAYLQLASTRRPIGGAHGVATLVTNWYVNHCPILARAPRAPSAAPTPDGGFPERAHLSGRRYTQKWASRLGPDVPRPPSMEGRPPLDGAKMAALHDLVVEMELNFYYGQGGRCPKTGEPQATGLRAIIQEDGGLIDLPENRHAYRLADFIRDVFRKARLAGGAPDVLLLSSSFLRGAASSWNAPFRRVDAGSTVCGKTVDLWESDAARGAVIVEAPLLRPSTAVALASGDLRLLVKQEETWHSARREFTAEAAVLLDNPHQAVWLEGVQAFAAG